MGMWDYFYSTSDFLKRNAPDQTTVKGWCSSSYGIGSAAVNKIDKAVRIDAPHKVKQCMTDEEARSRIGQAATYIAKEAAYYGFHEGLKTLPGGAPVSKFFKHFEQKSESHEKRELKALQTRVGKLEEEISICRKLMEPAEIHKPARAAMKSQKALPFNSEDGIRAFRMEYI
ncbi:hypothetical protein I3843_11G171400 [Carya illinoinensis]|nr:hypothetical protein I3843_11G171400 [Carya illinoinensis]